MPRQGLCLAAAAILALAFSTLTLAQDTSCRMGPGSSHSGCGLPYELANFQGFFECANEVRVGRPASLEDLQRLVAAYPQVKGSGVGHSWWKEQFCAGANASAINIVTTELRPTFEMMASPVDPKQWKGRPVPPFFPIQVDEEVETVTVAAGISQRVLLDYLAEHKHWKQPSGWTLPAFTWFLDQTIGGAVATGSHGSSMRHGSLSAQVRSLKLVLANGTLIELSPRTNRHLFLAAGVSVGRLGIITEITFRIRPQQAIKRTLQDMSFADFAQQVKAVQDAYAAAKKAGDVEGMRRALFQLDEAQAFWAVPLSQVSRVDYEHLDREPLAVLLNAMPQDEPLVQAMSGPDEAAYAQVERRAVAANSRMPVNTRFWANLYNSQLRPKLAPGTYEARKAYLSMAEGETRTTSTFAPYDQYEVVIPMERAGSCLMEVGSEVYGDAKLWEGFRTPLLVRFVTGEDFYLSPTVDGPAMYINMEDYISRSNGNRPNEQFQRTLRLFRERCSARLHWGKDGWPQLAKCFQGAKEYPDTWCHFGCAARELDPTNKFASEWRGWQWQAARGGQPVPFASCCTSTGFSPACTCAPRTDCS